jgi:dTMP kinase
MKYKFITFEGVEGCGKSTQSKLLAEFFQKRNIQTVLTREPGGTKVAEEIRKILVNGDVNKMDGVTETLLNFAARRDHIENLIKPALKEKKIVISDRFFDSTLAYQGYGYEGDLENIKRIQESSIGNFAPDITFLIDIDVDITMQRIQNREDNNRYEDMSLYFHKRVKNGFDDISKINKNRFRVINGKKSIKEIHQDILFCLELMV